MNRRFSLVVVAAIALFAAFYLAQPEPVLAQTTGSKVSLEPQIVAKEKEGLDALKTGDLTSFGNLTAEDAVFVDGSGAANKETVLRNVAGFKLTDYSMEDLKYVQISPNSGLISYKITEKGNSHGHDFTAKALVYSVWAERSHKWVCLFSQETGIK